MTQGDKSIIAALKDAKRKAVVKAMQANSGKDVTAKLAWEQRRRYIDSVLDQFQERSNATRAGRTVFVSYSTNTGKLYFDSLKERLAKNDFEVHTGFARPPDRDDGSVLGRVLAQLRRCSLYCAILTKELEVDDKGTKRWAPSVWTIEEKGMALALGKPFVLLIDEGIHDNFWLKTVPHKLHFRFNSENYQERFDEAVLALMDRYTELASEIVERQSNSAPALTERSNWGSPG